MKKSLIYLLLLLLIGGALLYHYFLNPFNADWEIKKVPLRIIASGGPLFEKSGAKTFNEARKETQSHVDDKGRVGCTRRVPKTFHEAGKDTPASNRNEGRHDVVFLNDMYRDYDGFSSQHEHYSTKFVIDLSTVSKIKGKIEKSKKSIRAEGKEIIFGIRGIGYLLKKQGADRLRMLIDTDKDVDIKVFEVFKNISPRKKYSHIDPGSLIHRLSKFSFMAQVPGKPGTQKLDIELSNCFVKGRRRAEGLVLIIKSQNSKAFNAKITEISLKSYRNKLDERFPVVDYFKHGKTWLKSLFIPVNSTISYSIKAKETFFLSGYLGAFPGETLQYIIKAGGKVILSRQVAPGISYFRHEVTPAPGKDNVRFEISVKSEGKKSGSGVLGNFTFFNKKKKGENRNVLFYLIDALRSDYGGHKNSFETHFKEGAVFANAYANACWTADSLPVIFSGKYKFALVDDPVFHPNLAAEEYTLAEYLKDKGYTTAAFIANSFLVKNNSYQGFDFVYLCWKGKRDLSLSPTHQEYMDYKYGDMETFIERFVEENKDKKSFIYIHTLEPHDPYELPMEMRRYSKDFDSELLQSVHGKFKAFLKNPAREQIAALKALYRDEVSASYRFFEKTAALFEKEGILNNHSLSLLTSDHGERFFEHGSWVHGRPDVFDEVLRIPFLLKGPGIHPGSYEKNVQLADIYPTVMDWFGDEKKADMVGHSLIPYTHGAAGEFKHRVIYADGAQHPFQYSYIVNNIKVIIENDTSRVYNLSKDPGETKDLSGEKRFARMTAEAGKFRDRFKKTTGKKKTTISAEELERLKSLGYLE